MNAERVIGVAEAATLSALVEPIVVFGGVTRAGNRRARDACRAAMSAGYDVIWFDGFEEVASYEGVPQRVPLDAEPIGQTVVVIGYAGAERHLLINSLPIANGRAVAAAR